MKQSITLSRSIIIAVMMWLRSENLTASMLMEEKVTNLQLIQMLMLFASLTVAVFSAFSVITLVALLVSVFTLNSLLNGRNE